MECAVFATYKVNTVTIAQKKARQVSFVDQKEDPSSNANSTPPIGAPKAAATPAAAPHATKSRFSASFLNSWNLLNVVSIPQRKVCPYSSAT